MNSSIIFLAPLYSVLALLFCTSPLDAATWNSNGSQSDVQAKIDAASNGDTVTIPSGTFAWTTDVGIVNKGIILQGNGAANTTIERGSGVGNFGVFFIEPHATAVTRVTGIRFYADLASFPGFNASLVAVGGDAENKAKFRIDHCKFEQSTDMIPILQLNVLGSAYGLIDNCEFYAPSNCEQIHNVGRSASDPSPDWTNDVVPGSDQALYVEDCYFENNAPGAGPPFGFVGNSSIQNYKGARVVFRHNTMQMCHVDVHGTPGQVAGRWWEIYNNHFRIIPNGNQSDCMALRGGSGVVFNNTRDATGGSLGGIVFREEDTGSSYPALYQIGRGKNQALDPAYFWNNGDMDPPGCVEGCNLIQIDRDYYSGTQRPGYTPYTYPHPLQGAAPTGAIETLNVTNLVITGP